MAPMVNVVADRDLIIRVDCPRCGIPVEVFGHLAARLVVDEDGGAIRAVLKTKPVDHSCGQLRLEVTDPATAPLFDEAAQLRRTPSGLR